MRSRASSAGDVVLAIGRRNQLKNLPLTMKAFYRSNRVTSCGCSGSSPSSARRKAPATSRAPIDKRVNPLHNRATVFLQTSIHEGFCLPPLEAMAAGTPVVCTDADGNRDFCMTGELPDPRARRRAAVSRGDPDAC